MGDLFTEHLFVGVGMGVDMDQRDGAVFRLDRLQDRPCQRVIAAQRQGDDIVVQDRDGSGLR